MKFNVKNMIPHVAAMIVILILSLVYFSPQFQGKRLVQSDMINWKAMSQETKVYKEKTGKDVMWTNSMFGGMPTYQIGAYETGNLLSYVNRALNLWVSSPAGVFILGMLSFYLAMLVLGINPWLSLIGAIMFGFSTNNMILFDAGHLTKTMAIMSSAPIIAGAVLVYRKSYLLGGFIFCMFLGLNLFANHVQMTFYLGLSMIPLALFYLYESIKEKTMSHYSKATLVLVIGTLLALGSSASKMWTTYEYSKDTMRGEPILSAQSNQNISSSSNVKGLDWDYAMQWSNGASDLFASFIPKVVGGGSSELVDKDSALAKAVGSRKDMNAPLYWGGLPFTSGPNYFGALVFFLFLFGALTVKGKLKWWLVIAVILTTILSMGKNFPIFNKLLFDYFPLFNKFRTPNSVLSVTAVFIPILAVMALQQLITIKDKSSLMKPLFWTTGIVGGICLLFGLLGPSLFSFESPGDAQYQQVIEAIHEDRASALSSSSFRSFFIIVLGAGLIYAFIKGKVSQLILLFLIGWISFIDLYQVDKRYLNNDDFVPARKSMDTFNKRPVDEQILRDTDPYYRVLDATVSTFNSAIPSYHHKTIGGYHAAKLQRYQDVIERHISQNNQRVLNMLNTKYFITPGANNLAVAQQNPAALGNAWFINNIVLVDNANAEIDALNTFDPAGDAIVHKEYTPYVNGYKPVKEGTISLSSYAPDELHYKTHSTTDQFAVFSEIWYGPNKGWQAYLDDKPVDHIRVNYLLRGMKIPAGSHEVKFVFNPRTYRLGYKISFVSSLIILLIGGFILGKYIIKKKGTKDA